MKRMVNQQSKNQNKQSWFIPSDNLKKFSVYLFNSSTFPSHQPNDVYLFYQKV